MQARDQRAVLQHVEQTMWCEQTCYIQGRGCVNIARKRRYRAAPVASLRLLSPPSIPIACELHGGSNQHASVVLHTWFGRPSTWMLRATETTTRHTRAGRNSRSSTTTIARSYQDSSSTFPTERADACADHSVDDRHPASILAETAATTPSICMQAARTNASAT